jgi:hypothetical protein
LNDVVGKLLKSDRLIQGLAKPALPLQCSWYREAV